MVPDTERLVERAEFKSLPGTLEALLAVGIVLNEDRIRQVHEVCGKPGAREQSLIFAISTAGWDQHSVCFEQREHARQVAEAWLP